MRVLSFYMTDGKIVRTNNENDIALYYSAVNSSVGFKNMPMILVRNEGNCLYTVNIRHVMYTKDEEI
jgi:hypothetical protein